MYEYIWKYLIKSKEELDQAFFTLCGHISFIFRRDSAWQNHTLTD